MAELIEKINQDLKEAMKARQERRLATLRLLKSEFQYEMNKTGAKDLQDPEALAVIRRAYKKRKDSIDQYRNAGRDELALQEEEEQKILEEYLPAEVSGDAIQAAIDEAVASIQPSGPSDMGKVMSAVMGKFKGQNINGALVKELVQKRLQS